MVGDTCCELCSRPLRFGMMSVQNYVVSLHALIHKLEDFRKNFNHFERRLSMANDVVERKVINDLEALSADYQTTLKEFSTLLESPYYVKVESFYPDLFKVLAQLSRKVLNSREAKVVLNAASEV